MQIHGRVAQIMFTIGGHCVFKEPENNWPVTSQYCMLTTFGVFEDMDQGPRDEFMHNCVWHQPANTTRARVALRHCIRSLAGFLPPSVLCSIRMASHTYKASVSSSLVRITAYPSFSSLPFDQGCLSPPAAQHNTDQGGRQGTFAGRTPEQAIVDRQL